MDTMRATTGRIGELDEVLRNHPGVTEVQLRLRQPGRSTTLRLKRRVTASEALFGDLKALLGPGCLGA